jgi:hypothetical protein
VQLTSQRQWPAALVKMPNLQDTVARTSRIMFKNGAYSGQKESGAAHSAVQVSVVMCAGQTAVTGDEF